MRFGDSSRVREGDESNASEHSTNGDDLRDGSRVLRLVLEHEQSIARVGQQHGWQGPVRKESDGVQLGGEQRGGRYCDGE